MTTDRPWLSSYAPGVPATVDVPDESLFDMLEHSVERFGPLVALDFYGSTTTYAELGEQVQRAAEALRRLGVERGDRVALALPNCPQHVVAFYAVLRLGAIVVEHNPLYTAGELEHQLADHGARVAIVWDKAVPVVQKVAGQTAVETVVACGPHVGPSPGQAPPAAASDSPGPRRACRDERSDLWCTALGAACRAGWAAGSGPSPAHEQ